MRFLKHDVRDFGLAFSLSFNLRRVSQAGVALCWTLICVGLLLGTLAWRVAGDPLDPLGLDQGLRWLLAPDITWARTLVWTLALGGWLPGFLYLCAPVLRGCAFEIARDDNEPPANNARLFRNAALAPFSALLVPAVLLLLAFLLTLLTNLDGIAGAIGTGLGLSLALPLAIAAAAGLIVVALAAPMMGPTAVVEGRDTIEALSRPIGYVLQAPLRYLAYMAAKLGVTALSSVAGGLCLALTWGILWVFIRLAGNSAALDGAVAVATARADVDFASQPVAAILAAAFWGTVGLWLCWLMVVALCADLIVYLLLRYRLDGVTMEKLAIVEERLAKLPTAVETAAEAEEARKRFDAQQAAQPAAPEPQQTATPGA
ncbi:MAG: hypothetical protein IT463_14665 [Planctomycetes bacterium]|nr:hypothetical protein [Planctomycetota bacterium]